MNVMCIKYSQLGRDSALATLNCSCCHSAEQKCRESTGKYHFRSENWKSVLMPQRVILLFRMVWTNSAQGVPAAMENIHAAKLLWNFSLAESEWCGLVQFDIGVRGHYSPQMMIN